MSGDQSGFGGMLAAAQDAEPAASVDVVARRLRKRFEARAVYPLRGGRRVTLVEQLPDPRREGELAPGS